MIYEYECRECKTEKSVEHGMLDTPKFKCKKCKKIMTKKILSTPIHFKGTGWSSPGKY